MNTERKRVYEDRRSRGKTEGRGGEVTKEKLP